MNRIVGRKEEQKILASKLAAYTKMILAVG
jgi:hypothetical protein